MTPMHVVVMGVGASGKSAVAERIATRLQLPLIEGDDFHPEEDIRRMREGVPPSEGDREVWLKVLADELAARPDGAVLACSALRKASRNLLRDAVPELRFVHVVLTRHQAMERAAARTDHFYPPSLVGADFDQLEDPAGEEGVLAVDGTLHVEEIAARAAKWLES